MMALADLPVTVDLLVVGGGPAGMAGAVEAGRQKLDVLLVDENPSLGGQIYRAIGRSPVTDRTVLGADYWAGEALANEVEGLRVPRLQSCTVWTIERAGEGEPFTVGLSAAGSARMIAARAILLATGAIERPFPIPGWTLPTVMTVGAAQTALKASGLVPDGRVVLAGCGSLLYLLAWQYRNAGVRIEALLDTTPRGNWRRAARHAPGFLASRYLAKGARLLVDVARSIRIIRGVTALRAEGIGQLAAVTYHGRDGEEQRIEADLLLLHQGVTPNVNLSLACGLKHVWDERQLCFRPELDRFGEGSVPGLFVMGDGGAIGGAEAAPLSGRLAALGAASRLGRLDAGARERVAAPIEAARARAGRGRSFLDLLYRPAKAFRVPDDPETIVCRCEEVSAGRIRRAVELGATGPNQVKSFERCGMGPCQGRLCGLTVTELIADARGLSPGEVGHYRIRPPVKPITLAELASMPKTDEAVGAVVRL